MLVVGGVVIVVPMVLWVTVGFQVGLQSSESVVFLLHMGDIDSMCAYGTS